MSFRCDQCKESQPPRTRPVRVVTQQVKRSYHMGHGQVSFGCEIKTEEKLCASCAEEVGECEIVDLGGNPEQLRVRMSSHRVKERRGG